MAFSSLPSASALAFPAGMNTASNNTDETVSRLWSTFIFLVSLLVMAVALVPMILTTAFSFSKAAFMAFIDCESTPSEHKKATTRDSIVFELVLLLIMLRASDFWTAAFTALGSCLFWSASAPIPLFIGFSGLSGTAIPRFAATFSASPLSTCESSPSIRVRISGVSTLLSSKRKALMICCCSTSVWLSKNSFAWLK
ncbi:hypothetical protein D3C86_1562350 [compost metagenome]